MRKLHKVEIVINTSTEEVVRMKAVMTERELTALKNRSISSIGAATLKRKEEADQLRCKLAELEA